MNAIEEHLYEHPEILEEFMKNNEELLNNIKDRFAGFLENGDVVSKFLLMKAVMEIIRTVGEASKILMKHELQQQGINITSVKGTC